MVDPTKFTNFNLSSKRLEEYILFCIAVAGKQAVRSAALLEKLLQSVPGLPGSPFDKIKFFGSEEKLREAMKKIGFGCFNLKARGFWWIANSGLNLKTCTVGDLEKCPGIGMKTSRFFVMHTRENSHVACLDTHILKFMRDAEFPDVPKQTPSKKHYLRLEALYLEYCKERDYHPAHFDLVVWNKYAGYVQ